MANWDEQSVAAELLACEAERRDREPFTDEWPELDVDTGPAADVRDKLIDARPGGIPVDTAGLNQTERATWVRLASVEETVLIYPSTGGRPKARRMLTETTTTQHELAQIFGLARHAPTT